MSLLIVKSFEDLKDLNQISSEFLAKRDYVTFG